MKKSWLTPWERNQRGEEEEAPGASASAGGHSSGSWCNRGLRLATFITDLTISVTAAKTQKVGELRGARHDSGAEMEGWEWSWYEWRTVKQRSWTGSRLFQDFVVHKARRVTFRRETATTTVLPCHVTSCEPATWGKTVLLFAFMCVAATAVEFTLFIHLSVVCFVVLYPAVIVSHCISVAKRNLLHPPSYPLLLFIAVGLFLRLIVMFYFLRPHRGRPVCMPNLHNGMCIDTWLALYFIFLSIYILHKYFCCSIIS